MISAMAYDLYYLLYIIHYYNTNIHGNLYFRQRNSRSKI